jgi:hypothetical protein
LPQAGKINNLRQAGEISGCVHNTPYHARCHFLRPVWTPWPGVLFCIKLR